MTPGQIVSRSWKSWQQLSPIWLAPSPYPQWLSLGTVRHLEPRTMKGGGGLRAFDLQAWRHSIVDELFLFISDKTEQCHVILWNVISALLHESGSDINNNADKFQCIECDEGGRLEPFGRISRTGTHRIIYREPRNPQFGWSKGLICLWSNVKTTVRMIEKQDPCCLKDTTHPPTTVLIYIHVYDSLYIHNHSRERTNHLKMDTRYQDNINFLEPGTGWDTIKLLGLWVYFLLCSAWTGFCCGQRHLYVCLPAPPLTREYTLCELSYQINYILFQ